MKKTILSAAIAALTLSAGTASALDLKLGGGVKVDAKPEINADVEAKAGDAELKTGASAKGGDGLKADANVGAKVGGAAQANVEAGAKTPSLIEGTKNIGGKLVGGTKAAASATKDAAVTAGAKTKAGAKVAADKTKAGAKAVGGAVKATGKAAAGAGAATVEAMPKASVKVDADVSVE